MKLTPEMTDAKHPLGVGSKTIGSRDPNVVADEAAANERFSHELTAGLRDTPHSESSVALTKEEQGQRLMAHLHGKFGKGMKPEDFEREVGNIQEGSSVGWKR